MKKYLVIKRYKALSPAVETSFDVKDDAFQYARLCEVRDDNKYEYIVAEVLQCKRGDEYKTSALSLTDFTFGKLCLQIHIPAQQLINKFS